MFAWHSLHHRLRRLRDGFCACLHVSMVLCVFVFSLRFEQAGQIEVRANETMRTLMQRLGPHVHFYHEPWLRLVLTGIGWDRRLQRGDYAYAKDQLLLQVVLNMYRGHVIECSLRIIEGWDISDVNASLAERGSEINLTRAKEGRFLPDTYHYRHTDELESILQHAQQAQLDYLYRVWGQRADDLPWRSWEDVIIAASLVEKETALPEERPRVAQVMINRLNRGMLLQIDAAVIYGLDRPSGKVYHKDLKRDHPLNTYTRHGLPAHPICMPSRAAIDATLHPSGEPSLYYVLRQDGRHEFTNTLKAHLKAKKDSKRGKK